MAKKADQGSMHELVRGLPPLKEPVYWCGPVGPTVDGQLTDDFGAPIGDEFIDGKTKMGPWGNMAPSSWEVHGIGKLGTGLGQRYKRQADGRWLKVEG